MWNHAILAASTNSIPNDIRENSEAREKSSGGDDGNIQTHAGAIESEVANPYAGEIADFVAAIEEGRPPEVPGEEGQGNVELLCEICP